MNTIVIGGGQAGITLSYFLQQRGVEHLVLERDRAFSAWHNCWDSFPVKHSQLDEHLARHAKTICTAQSLVRHRHTRRSTRLFPCVSPDGQSPVKRRRHRHASRRRRKHLARPYRHQNLSNDQRRHLHRVCCPTLFPRRCQKTAANNPPVTLINLSKPRPDHNAKRPHRRQRQQWGSNLPGPGAIGPI